MSEGLTDDLPGFGPDPEFPSKIVVCGGRDYTDRRRIREVLAEYVPDDPGAECPTLLHGGARGADRLAAREAFELGFWVGEVPADWAKHKKAAGPIRNQAMLDRNPDLVIAFPGGKGTADMVGRAERAGVHVRHVGARPRAAEATTDKPLGEAPDQPKDPA